MAIQQNIAILTPWVVITDSPEQQKRADLLSAGLKKDLPEGHPLRDLDLKAVANRTDCDDVLFEVIGGEQPLAVVHLTWQKETDPRWPKTKLFKNWQQWVEEVMLPDHQYFTAGA